MNFKFIYCFLFLTGNVMGTQIETGNPRRRIELETYDTDLESDDRKRREDQYDTSKCREKLKTSRISDVKGILHSRSLS